MNKGKIFLTSTGFSSNTISQKFTNLCESPSTSAVVIVTTAAEGKEENKYSQLAKKQFESMGFVSVDFIDLETQPESDLSSYAVVYVCGGNTFKLLKFAQESNFKLSIEHLLERNGVYIGVSAGSIIVGPSIQIAGEVAGDENEIGLENLTGFGITDLIILPHYSPEIEQEVKFFEEKYNVIVERINNSQAVFIEDEKKTIIE
jgi:dipeptidase E